MHAADPDRLAPLPHRLGPYDDDALAGEQSLFAAEQSFAAEFGGPITRAFLAALPAGWRGEPLVVDSHLVGLPPGYDPGPTVWHREAYPEYAGGAFDAANAERAIGCAWCVFGPVTPELLVGAVDEAALPAVTGWDKPAVAARDAALRGLVDAGALSTWRPAAGEVFFTDGDTFMRWHKATAPGLHLWLRATRGSGRPWANGRRNSGMKG